MQYRSLIGLAAVLAAAAGANASVGVTVGASAPTYTHTLNFDEPGTPTGLVSGSEWTGLGISSIVGGAGDQVVDQFNTNPGFGWLGTGNAFGGPWGIVINFSSPLSDFSAQYWDNSGPATFFGGGAIVVAVSGGVEVGSLFLDDPAYGGVGDEWINISATSGSTFDEVRLVGFGFFPQAYTDNLSWNTVPTPSAAAVGMLGMIAAGRRRRQH